MAIYNSRERSDSLLSTLHSSFFCYRFFPISLLSIFLYFLLNLQGENLGVCIATSLRYLRFRVDSIIADLHYSFKHTFSYTGKCIFKKIYIHLQMDLQCYRHLNICKMLLLIYGTVKCYLQNHITEL